MEIVINILNNSLRKDEKILKRYKIDGNEIGYANMLKQVNELKKAIKILNDNSVPQGN